METASTTRSPSTRLRMGAAILTGAGTVNVKSAASRLLAFSEVHASYVEAQGRVIEIEAQLRADRLRLKAVDADQHAAIEALASRLVYDGQPRHFPFAAFGVSAPWAIKRMAFAETARTIHRLVAAVQGSKLLSPATLDAARAAERAAQDMEGTLREAATTHATLQTARHSRNVIGQRWETALGALRRSARAAADDGAPGLYAALFGRQRHSRKKQGSRDR